MIVLNFAHPLTTEHLAQIEALTGQTVERVIERPAQFEPGQSFGPQVVALTDSVGLPPVKWQELP